MKMNRRKRLFLLFFAFGLIIVVAVLVFFDREVKPAAPPPKSHSDLAISAFRHTATEKGKILWSLEADRAEYRRQEKLVDLFTVKIDYFRDDGTKITATSEKGSANMGSHDLELTGAVEVLSPGYKIRSELLRYIAENRTLISPGKTFISGEGLSAESDAARYDVASGLVFLSGNAKGEIRENP